ncbi:uncharacterized protein [Muntiacus reevesi]|uniref:uncharacterized protein n=1 Tax=Muntiacus reevesi TaxID=9886 RepID=UPI003307804F
MAPLAPSPFAPFRLPAASESEWTPVLSCSCPRLFSNSTHSFLHGYIQGGTATERAELPVLGLASGSILGIDWSPRDRQNELFRGAHRRRKSRDSRPASSPALLRLRPSSSWLAGCYRHWDGRAEPEDESTSKQPTGASSEKQSVAYYSLFSTPKGGGGTGRRLLGATLPPAVHRNQNASKPGRKPILPAWFRSRGLDNVDGKLMGDAPEDQRKKGNLWKGPGLTTPDRASSAGPALRTTARRARSQGVHESLELLRAGSGPAPGSIEDSASLPACVRWEISPRNRLELSTEGPDP